jgi:Glycosyl transferase family 2
VVDSGTEFRLEPAAAPDVEVGGEIRYGTSESVPSRLDDPATGLATVVVVASSDPAETRRAIEAMASTVPADVDLVLVSDGLPDRALEGLRGGDLAALAGSTPAELVRTSTPLGQAAALNIGIRRSRAPVVIVLDPSVVPGADIVTPLVRALDDPTAAIAGPFGLVSADLRRFDEVVAPAPAATPAHVGAPATATIDAAAIQGYLMAFRRADAIARGPLDEGFRFYRNLDIWWSLVLRDESEGEDEGDGEGGNADEGLSPRRAVVVPGLSLTRGEPRAWATTAPADRDRLSKRNFYRILDRFRTRLDLAVPPPKR